MKMESIRSSTPSEVLVMFSEKRKALGTSAAWRIAAWPAVAFAAGVALALTIMYFFIARDTRARSDAWLSGEAETLADVSAKTPRDSLYGRLVEEVAELATHEVSDTSLSGQQNSVFFLQMQPNEEPIWVGPAPKQRFIEAIQSAQLVRGTPGNVHVDGWKLPFRVVYHSRSNAGGIYLGFADFSGAQMLDRLTEWCLLVWGITVVLGFLLTWVAAYRTLSRVERISETVSRIGSDDLSSRLPEGPHPDEISRLSNTFNKMLDRIQSSVHQLRILTDTVAHDLKSPVTSIRGTLEVALAQADRAQLQEQVAEAIEGLDRLSEMLNTTLDLAEADAGALPLQKETIELAGLIQTLVDLYQPAMDERGHRVTTRLQPIMVDADQSLMNRMIANLLDNEVAHLPSGCEVDLAVEARGQEAAIMITDNGPGFAPEFLSRACERFVKGEHSSGHGLGLAFVQAVVTAHGGNIVLSNQPGGGAVISLSMPTFALPADKGREGPAKPAVILR
jgi:signal transduction histidine kinase